MNFIPAHAPNVLFTENENNKNMNVRKILNLTFFQTKFVCRLILYVFIINKPKPNFSSTKIKNSLLFLHLTFLTRCSLIMFQNFQQIQQLFFLFTFVI